MAWADAVGRWAVGERIRQARSRAVSTGQDLEQVVFIPAGPQPFVLDAELGGLLRPQQVQRDPPQPREVLGPIALADPAGVLIEAEVQRPVQLVLDLPVPVDQSGKGLSVGVGQAADEIATFLLHAAVGQASFAVDGDQTA